MDKSVDKIIALYNYIAELVKSGTKIVTDVTDYLWTINIDDFPEDNDYITINKSILSGAEDCLLSIKKPEPISCPRPDARIEHWLEKGWDNCDKNVIVKEYIQNSEAQYTFEYFNSDEKRVEDFNAWKTKRDKWAEKESVRKRIRSLFARFFKIHSDFKADSESFELIVANGIFTDKTNSEINHPIITRRLKINFDADTNVISIEDTDAYTELYTTVLQEVDGINNNAISDLEQELNAIDFFPIGSEANEFLNRFTHEMSSECSFIRKTDDVTSLNSRFVIKDEPVLILRKRIAGTVNCIENVIKNINETQFVPETLLKLVGGSEEQVTDDYHEPTITEQLAAASGEDVDILLSKEANREQLEIAQRIENYDAVVVQGPPGTGKTHTIANLLGHFLAQGKSILVTSHTRKALSVLKDKVEPGIQDLCVSMLEDSNADMQRSIENIAEKRARLSSAQLKKEIEKEEAKRADTISELADVRNKIYSIKYSEQNTIAINGESVSPSEVAKFVSENAENLSCIIPGRVNVDKSMPLELDEIKSLYESNGIVSAEEEFELDGNLPNVDVLILPSDFANYISLKNQLEDDLQSLCKEHAWKIHFDSLTNTWVFQYGKESVLKDISEATVQKLANIANAQTVRKPWQIKVATDGLKGEVFVEHWNILFECLKEACKISDKHDSIAFGKKLNLGDASDNDKVIFEKIKEDYLSKGKPSKFRMSFNRSYKEAYEKVRINNKEIASADDCELVINTIELNSIREKCSNYWNELFTTNDVPAFLELNQERPELVARKWIQDIKINLSWISTEYPDFRDTVESIGVDFNTLFSISGYESAEEELNKISTGLANAIPALYQVVKFIQQIETIEYELTKAKDKLISYSTNLGGIGKLLYDDLASRAYEKYEDDYTKCFSILKKNGALIKRNALIAKLKKDAPEWAASISNRDGIHGLTQVPERIIDAWKWKQYNQIAKQILDEPFNALLAESVKLSKLYRKETAKLAEIKAWYYLIKRTESNNELVQHLEGWRQTVAKIGKGTGKNAPKLKSAARDLMGKCQKAIPCWIMTINKAIESLKPTENHFDIVIVDEASQANISSLAIAYMTDKIIIVGDDKQVSPMAVGEDVDRSNKLAEMYLKGNIPNWQLFDAKLSLYALATTSYKPLMLKEHFRCVPDIIGYSNKLSYDFKIKPLRDSSSSDLLPAMVTYRAPGGKRNGKNKINNGEARAISALIRACIEQEEYAGKTFGVISLVGADQAKKIYQRLISDISPAEIERRQILCGDASNFQGDERDVMFLSMVDSSEKGGPLPIANAGSDDWRKKRYNVAVSRAKDQLWIVHSFDVANDLKPGDMRKDLLDYASNPSAFAQKIKKIEEEADSPFEIEVAQRLVAKGYHITQQWPVGAYSIDMVASCANRKVAIECDGERWHSGEEKIREDMERQTILERSGWTFIRIRGSEFYTDKDATMERVFNELSMYEIMPESDLQQPDESAFPLLERIKNRAADLLGCKDEQEELVDFDTIEFALNDKEVAIEIQEESVSDIKRQGLKINEPKLEIESVRGNKQTAINDNEHKLSDAEKRKPKDKKKGEQTGEQISFFEIPKEEPARKQKETKSDKVPENLKSILSALDSTGWEYIDHSAVSDIIYLISDNANKEKEIEFLDTLDCHYELEKRGTIATNNRRAWRIMIKKQGE